MEAGRKRKATLGTLRHRRRSHRVEQHRDQPGETRRATGGQVGSVGSEGKRVARWNVARSRQGRRKVVAEPRHLHVVANHDLKTDCQMIGDGDLEPFLRDAAVEIRNAMKLTVDSLESSTEVAAIAAEINKPLKQDTLEFIQQKGFSVPRGLASHCMGWIWRQWLLGGAESQLRNTIKSIVERGIVMQDTSSCGPLSPALRNIWLQPRPIGNACESSCGCCRVERA